MKKRTASRTRRRPPALPSRRASCRAAASRCSRRPTRSTSDATGIDDEKTGMRSSAPLESRSADRGERRLRGLGRRQRGASRREGRHRLNAATSEYVDLVQAGVIDSGDGDALRARRTPPRSPRTSSPPRRSSPRSRQGQRRRRRDARHGRDDVSQRTRAAYCGPGFAGPAVFCGSCRAADRRAVRCRASCDLPGRGQRRAGPELRIEERASGRSAPNTSVCRLRSIGGNL